jgi:hypothetical protein
MAGLVVLEDFLGGTPGAGVALEGGLRRGDEEGLDGGPDRRAEREGGGHEGGEWHRLEAEAEGDPVDGRRHPDLGSGRIVALHNRMSTLYQIH